MRKILIIIVSIYTCSVNAALIDNNIYTTDTTTNLDWLDLTATLGMTPNEIRFQLSTKWDNDAHAWVESNFMGGGWNFATESQAIDLVTRYIGTSFGRYEIGSQPSINARSLMNLLGLTYANFTAGIYLDSNNTFDLIKINDFGTLCNGIICYEMEALNYDISYAWYTNGGSAVGKFLVRDNISAVPVPSSFLLFISGLGILFNSRLKKVLTSSSTRPFIRRFASLHSA